MSDLDRATASQGDPQPFVQLPVGLLRSPDLSSDDLRLLAVILARDWAGSERGCTTTITRLARECSRSESSIKRAIKRLNALGYLLASEYLYHRGSCTGIVLRVSAKVRPGRPMVAIVARSPQQLPLSAESSTPVHEPEQSPPRRFAQTFRPDVEREAVTDADTKRLAQLEAWACADPADMLGVYLGLIATRERQLGRTVDATRLRAIYDGAVRARILHKGDIASRPGLLLAGIERGFLLNTSGGAAAPHLPAGARDALVMYADRVADGGTVAHPQLRDLGISAGVLHPEHAPSDVRPHDSPDTTSDEVSAAPGPSAVNRAAPAPTAIAPPRTNDLEHPDFNGLVHEGPAQPTTDLPPPLRALLAEAKVNPSPLLIGALAQAHVHLDDRNVLHLDLAHDFHTKLVASTFAEHIAAGTLHLTVEQTHPPPVTTRA